MEQNEIMENTKQSFAQKDLKSIFLLFLGAFVLLSAIIFGVLFLLRDKIYAHIVNGYLASVTDTKETEGKSAESVITEKIIEKESIFTQEYFIVDAVKKTNPAVVSIIISKDVPKYEAYIREQEGFFGFLTPELRQNGTERKEIGSGSGFFVSNDGLILTNRHVVEDANAIYTVYTNDGKKHDAKVVARDPVLDIALIRVESRSYPFLTLGNSGSLQPGQTVIAIGNALGEFKNTVSVGVISGLSRTVAAGGSSGQLELLDHVIQTDAAINPGNSGGPLLDLSGRVIGVNVAVATGSQGIGFALPINSVKGAVESVKATGKIVRPYIGVRYVSITPENKDANGVSVDYGALVKSTTVNQPAIVPGSPAEKAGILAGDIILSIDGVKINETNSLASVMSEKKVGQTVSLRILRSGAERTVKVTLEAFSQN